ncbi:HD-GYP domain-containing protein [Bacillus suaedaesalsae]|uniref:HD domain-containing protein n=1 Tax=Bacillus suaedaesalsae TaxID=2810349 RepID=A0ABS2DGK9_9BACI|nr:HD-GYP domain-containing protein [Bacillus suaedaesalsae]MBM6617594.1 HD domain-containing protein [Bacillus suaedaesalsae]
MKKLVFATWFGTSLSTLFITSYSTFVLQEALTKESIYTLIAIIVAYLPYFLVHQYVSKSWKKLLFLLTTTCVIASIFYLAPYIGHVIFYIIPIYAVLFKEKIYFIFAFFISLIGYTTVLVLQPFISFYPLYEFIQLLAFITYTVILYYVSTVSAKQEKLNSMYTKTMEALVLAIEAKDDYTRGHSTRVSEYSMILGTYLENNGFQVDLEVLRISSLLHDIGKVNIPIDILQKKGKLTEKEYEEIKKHPTFGAEIAISLEFPEEITEPILYHHERMDGKGYPHGLKGESIPLLARIISIADTFDALTTNRSYRNAFAIDEAKEIIIDNSGTQFDDELIPYFIECFPSLRSRAEQLIELERQLTIAMVE